jgi:hypothetical protein
VTLSIRSAILALPDRGYAQMTVRGLFYVLATEGVVGKDEGGYRKVQRQALLLRRENILPWRFVADATRWRREPETFDSVEDALVQVARTYRRNLWRSQGTRIEVWLEKDALGSLISPVAYRWGVSLMVSRGQSSDTYVVEAAREAARAWCEAGMNTVVYALFDADSFGRNAAAKIEEKLAKHAPDVPISFELLAVTDEQIVAWNLPTRPGKRGEAQAVELDAVQVVAPGTLEQLVEDAILRDIDLDAWTKEQLVEESEREILERMAAT